MAIENPSQVFCKMLEYQYNNKITEIEDALFLPLKGIRDVKSNLLRVEKVIYGNVKTEVLSIETLLIEILFLDKINLLATVDNFCQIAFTCEKLVETLIDTSNNYLSFLDATTRSLISADYGLFEKHVCVLGLKNIVGLFTNDMLSKLRDRLVELQDSLDTNLRLTEIQLRYLTILQDSGIFTMLNDLRKYANCGFSVCDFATTSSNKIADYVEKLAIVETTSGAGWTTDLNSLLDNYNILSDEIDNKIIELIEIIDTRTFERNIPRDEVMII